MNKKFYNPLLVILGIMYFVSVLIIPQETLNDYEWFGLVFFIAPFGYLITRAIIMANQADQEECKE